ncbi:MAG: ATP-binding protein [candidate division NC10 bacterium]
MEAAKVFKRFSLLSAGAWVGLALVLGTGLTYYAERKMLERTTLASLDHFQHLPHFMIGTEDFVQLKVGEEYDRFDRFIKARFFDPKVFAIKIYDRSGVLVYHSRERSLVGRSFADNLQLERVLQQGHAVMEISELKGSEHVAERASGHGRLLEAYIPILQEGSGRVLGAYEIYSSLAPLYQDLWNMRAVVWSSVIFGLFLLYAVLTWTFRRASRTILDQNEALAKQAQDLKQAYEELKTAQGQLVRSERLASAGRLAAGIVHEIGNPLASILGMVDLLLRCKGRPQDRKECRENVERVASETIRLKGILQGLLDYTRPTGKQVRPLEVNKVVEKTMLLLLSHEAFHGIEVIRHLQEPSPWALADEGLLQQVLVNVLMNAAQAMPRGGRISIGTEAGPVKPWQEGTISVGRRFDPDEDAAIMTVADTGPGIPQKDLPRIFEPFFSTKVTGKGVGLGLAICHSIIEGLQGAITVESRRGPGTTFYILLPPDGGGQPHGG